MLHFAHEPSGRATRGILEECVRPQRQGIRIEAQQGAVVVEHLLEVGHRPLPVGGVTAETAADVVVDAAAGDLGERGHGHVEGAPLGRAVALGVRPMAQQARDGAGHRKLRGAAEPALHRIERGGQLLNGLVQQGAVFKPLGFHRGRRQAGQGARQPLALGVQFATLLLEGFGHVQQEVGKAGQVEAGRAREVGAAKEGQQRLWVEEHRERPAASLPRQYVEGGLVDLVDVWPFFAVHLHVHEQAVHHRRGGVVLEGFVCHDMAPMAGGVAHREQDGLVLGARQREGHFTPRMPIHRILRMLQEIGARLAGKSIQLSIPLGRERMARALADDSLCGTIPTHRRALGCA